MFCYTGQVVDPPLFFCDICCAVGSVWLVFPIAYAAAPRVWRDISLQWRSEFGPVFNMGFAMAEVKAYISSLWQETFPVSQSSKALFGNKLAPLVKCSC